jgi:hypothetical protein
MIQLQTPKKQSKHTSNHTCTQSYIKFTGLSSSDQGKLILATRVGPFFFSFFLFFFFSCECARKKALMKIQQKLSGARNQTIQAEPRYTAYGSQDKNLKSGYTCIFKYGRGFVFLFLFFPPAQTCKRKRSKKKTKKMENTKLGGMNRKLFETKKIEKSLCQDIVLVVSCSLLLIFLLLLR